MFSEIIIVSISEIKWVETDYVFSGSYTRTHTALRSQAPLTDIDGGGWQCNSKYTNKQE